MAQAGNAGVQQYNYDIVKKFTVMALIWGAAGMFAGVYIASELAWPLSLTYMNIEKKVRKK